MHASPDRGRLLARRIRSPGVVADCPFHQSLSRSQGLRLSSHLEIVDRPSLAEFLLHDLRHRSLDGDDDVFRKEERGRAADHQPDDRLPQVKAEHFQVLAERHRRIVEQVFLGHGAPRRGETVATGVNRTTRLGGTCRGPGETRSGSNLSRPGTPPLDRPGTRIVRQPAASPTVWCPLGSPAGESRKVER